jgi:CMP/dCMP kinase
MSEKRIIVALDGPAGSGKSTVARRIATKLGFMYINSGAIYRAVALWAIRLGTDLNDMHRLEQLAKEAKIELAANGRVILNGEDVTEAIHDPQVSGAASKVSVVPGVRRALLRLQRSIAERSSVVMEGRDIGSVVFPNAQVKIFLDADPQERARRRALELMEQRGQAADVETVSGELKERDDRDRRRSESPLVQAPDAELIDTTGLSLEQVEEAVLRVVRARISNGKEATL